MPRKPVVGGNWKMNLNRGEARALLDALRTSLGSAEGVDVIVFPPAPWLGDAHDVVEGSRIAVGAQNAYWEPKGAYTGEASAPMLAGTATYLLVGHSERRHVFGETDEETNRKMHAAVEAGLTPVLAVGETIEQMRAGETEATLRRQVAEGLKDFGALPDGTIIAYEPVWAIGTGEAATPEVAQERCAFIRSLLIAQFGDDAASSTRIQYGGSVNADNAATYFGQPDIDGALVGGASLDAAAFTAICEAAAQAG
ncbi:MAG: triose-phosphate isomerase [Chloroflexi bacterium]|nr:triose-phosphate isomerase [Chloroflexota bacterium]MQC18446.1 triose-phosphate isomerase [Chloroflexota bacterium]MQC48567.1 triose-phosphate isomerase [Chloroflexota bacterium]